MPDSSIAFVEHPLIRPGKVECRMYQETLLASAAKRNTLCIVPTGTGKTILALLLAALRLGKFGETSFAIIAAPSKPLAEQHFRTFADLLNVPEGSVVSITGKTGPTEREAIYSRRPRVICCTPQTLQNDIISGRISLKDASLLVVDEAHRACGNYPYQFIARKYMLDSRNPLILAITASPGSSEEKIREVCASLEIENVEIRTASDGDVRGFVNPVRVEWRKLDLPHDFLNVKKLLESAYGSRLSVLKRAGVIASRDQGNIKKRDLLDAQGKLLSAGERSPDAWMAISLLAEAIKLEHAIELLETQGARMLRDYFEKLEKSDRSKAAKKILADPLVFEAEKMLSEITYEHPKLDELGRVVREQLGRDAASRIIVFSSYRSSVSQLVGFLGKIEGCRPVALVGQAELSQKEQASVLDEFKRGVKNVLVGSSIAEEGLHVAGCELAVLYEPVSSALRSIQRRGRIGRTGAGRLVVLMAKDTRDERNYWIAENREKKMKSILRNIKLENDEPRKNGSLERWM